MNILRRPAALLLLGVSLSGCIDGYLTTEPPEILTDDVVWSNPSMITSVMANYYSRLPEHMDLTNFRTFALYDEALYSGITEDEDINQLLEYPYDTAALWDYSLIRDLNLAIERIGEASAPALTPDLKQEFIAELRFLRAWTYFEHVKRMGGVPIITEQMVYDFSGDPSSLQLPRNTEAEVYDFIAAELDEIADQLGNDGSARRANRFTALALKSRAMLYAGSIARFNNEMASPITLPENVVGIPADRAEEYFTKSLEASRAILTSGQYSLYRANSNPGENFYEALTVKDGNQEVIWVEDYLASEGLNHLFTLSIVPRSLRIDGAGTNQGAGLSPSLQLVETYDFLDGSPGILRGVGDGTPAGQADWIFYDEVSDIFDGKDGRLYGTVIYPGTSARGGELDLQAGVYVWNDGLGRYEKIEGARNSTYVDGGTLTGADGPRSVENYLSTTGFYLRKYLDPNPAGATSTTRSDIWWVRFRLGEIYLNAAEAAFELGMTGEALGSVNTLRERAGFPANSLTSLTRDKLRSERWAELAFEDHRVWDLKRWRIAHELWDGTANSTTANVWSLWPYRIVRPGHPDDGKFVFDKFPSARQTRPRYWRMGNYYSEIPASTRGKNPNLVANPFH